MNIFIVSLVLTVVYVTVCTSHRPTPRRRNSYVARAQIAKICNEIVTLKEEIASLKQRLDYQEQLSKEAG